MKKRKYAKNVKKIAKTGAKMRTARVNMAARNLAVHINLVVAALVVTEISDALDRGDLLLIFTRGLFYYEFYCSGRDLYVRNMSDHFQDDIFR